MVINVGKALKKVDRTFLQDWAKWCERIQGPRLQRGDAGWTAASSSSEGKIMRVCMYKYYTYIYIYKCMIIYMYV
jgi:hypothetical protein